MAPSSSTYGSAGTPSPQPSSIKSGRSAHSNRSSEATPLLSRGDGDDEEWHDQDAEQNQTSRAATSLRRSLHEVTPTKKTLKRRWPSLLALAVLCILVILIIVFGFFAPQIVEEYAMDAATFEPSRLSIDSFTSTGVRTRVQGEFYMDASKVEKKSVRDLGRFATWIARKAETGKTRVDVRLPDYGDEVLGSAVLPPIKVDIRNKKRTKIDVLSDLEPGSKEPLRSVAKDWIEGRLDQLKVDGTAKVAIRSGIVHLSPHDISQSLLFHNDGEAPALPRYNITKIDVHEVELPDGKGMAADVTISVFNDYPIDVVIPPLGFQVLVGNCLPTDPHIRVAEATTESLHAEPQKNVQVKVSGVVRDLLPELTEICPNAHHSPLDSLLGDYINGKEATIYVRGADAPSADTPQWIGEIMSAITVPVPLVGHTFKDLIRNFSLTDTQFSLPDSFAEPGTPAAAPKISTTIDVIVSLPDEMNFPVEIDRVKANATIYHDGKELGLLDIDEWQKANSTRLDDLPDGPALKIQADVVDAPIKITNDKVFSRVVRKLLFGSNPVILDVKAHVDAGLDTVIGDLAVRGVPAEGVVPVEPILGGGDGDGDGGDDEKGGFSSLKPHIGNLTIVSSTPDSIGLTALVNFTNPTDYSAIVPYIDLLIVINETAVGHVTAEAVEIVPGKNEGVLVKGMWQPQELGGDKGEEVGLEAISRYISGLNLTLGLRTHVDSIPAQPALGKAFESLVFKFPAPRPSAPKDPDDGDGDGDDDGGSRKIHFIEYTEMHLISSTAEVHLHSPLTSTALYITRLNATASYQNDTVGNILYDLPFEVPPGRSVSPRLPVDWNLGSVGYDAIKNALGGTLQLDANATIGLRIGRWSGSVWLVGHGVGAKVRL